MRIKIKPIVGAALFIGALITQAAAQAQPAAAPAKPARPFVVLNAQTLGEVERKLQPDSKTEELMGGAGMQLRVAVQHEHDKAGAAAEVHDASDDVYYVLNGTATLTLGGTLAAPHESEPGEWRAPRILGGQTVEIAKGDLIIVPRGTPHQRSTAGKDFTMILVKVFAVPLPAPEQKPAMRGGRRKP